MSNHNSPIIETSGSSNLLPVFIFLIAFLGFGVFYLFYSTNQSEVPTAEPVPTEETVAYEKRNQASTPSEYVPSAQITANKMNVFYIGVENPIEVSVPGISSNDLSISVMGGGAKLKKTGANTWALTVRDPTANCKVTVQAAGYTYSKSYRVKRIPDPVARLGNKADGPMGYAEFKAQQGLIAWLDNFDFDTKCQIQGFELSRITSDGTSEKVVNRGGRFTQEAANLVGSARPGDTFLFTRVRTRCSGDPAGRKINSLVFEIK